MSKVTLKEIAEKTGVSLGTVHRAIYGKSGIGEETRKRVLEEVERSNYQVDEAASILKRKEKKIIVVLPKPQGDERFFFRGFWKEIKIAAKEVQQYKIYFEYIESEYSLSEMWRELEKIYDEKLDDMDGLITIADGEKANIWVGRFAKRGIYTVLLSSYYVGENDMVRCIKSDHDRCGRLAAEFMQYGIPQKNKKILVLDGNSEIYSNGVYSRSFKKQMTMAGYDLVCVNGFGRAEIEEPCLHYLNTEDIQGVFVGNARNTFHFCNILQEKQINKNLLVVGTDVFEELVPFFENNILNAVVCQYQWEQGRKAVQRMHEFLNKGKAAIGEDITAPILLMKSNYDSFL